MEGIPSNNTEIKKEEETVKTKESKEKHIIDCDINPLMPNYGENWSIYEHQKGGELQWDPAKAELYFSDARMDGKLHHDELAGKLVLNANVLDYLLAHTELIPEDWKKYELGIFFWGTIYRHSNSTKCVRSLYWFNGSKYVDGRTSPGSWESTVGYVYPTSDPKHSMLDSYPVALYAS